jgi:hypothetical protein
VTSTVPGSASAVTRAATFTGLPNQSPARLTASPAATPALSRGRPLAAAASMSSRTDHRITNGLDEPNGRDRQPAGEAFKRSAALIASA